MHGAAISAHDIRHADDDRDRSRLSSPQCLGATRRSCNPATTRLRFSEGSLTTPANCKPMPIEDPLQRLRVLVLALANAQA